LVKQPASAKLNYKCLHKMITETLAL